MASYKKRSGNYYTSNSDSSDPYFMPYGSQFSGNGSVQNGNPGPGKGYGNSSAVPSELLNNYYAYKTIPTAGINMIEPSLTGRPHIFLIKPAIGHGLQSNKGNGTDPTYSRFKSAVGNIGSFFTSSPTTISDTICFPLSNLARSSSIDDVTMSTISAAETFRGYVQKLPSETNESKGGGDIEITYLELQYPVVTLFHKLWFDYAYNVRFGFYERPQGEDWRKIIDYASAIYYFLTGPDGKSITYWSRFIGVIPTSIPYSSFGGGIGENNIVEVRCAYTYSFKQSMDYDIINDFNTIAGGGSGANSISSGLLPIGGSSLSIKDNASGMPEFDFSPSVY
jgi:hypothetical protein